MQATCDTLTVENTARQVDQNLDTPTNPTVVDPTIVFPPAVGQPRF